MRSERNARIFFGVTSAIVTFGLVLQFILVATQDSNKGSFASKPAKILNFFSFFTVQSNIGVATTTAFLAWRPRRDSLLFRVLRLDAMICILVTGVVFHLALSGLQELTGWSALADFLLHTMSPILCPLGWLIFGPRRTIDTSVVKFAVIAPVGWLAYAFIYGALSKDRFGKHYYAYPFMNVGIHGYAVSLFRCAIVAVLFLGLAFGALALDKRLPSDAA